MFYMMQVLDFLKDSSGSARFHPYGNEIVFEIIGKNGEFDLKEVFLEARFTEDFDTEEFDYGYIDNSNFAILTANIKEIVSIRIKSCLGIDDREYSDKFYSISTLMFNCLREINKLKEAPIENYGLEVYDPGDGFCPGGLNYGFWISLKKEQFEDLVFFQSIIFILQTIEVPDTDLYLQFYSSKILIEDSGRISILNTNTKTRRIGYLKVLANLIDRTQKIPISKIASRLEIYALSFSEELGQYINTKGIIQKTKTGSSALPYVLLSKELGFLNTINTVYVQGKLLKVYILLKKELDKDSNNIFVLSKFDKLFFLESVLRTDYLYTTVILELLYINKQNNYTSLNEQFQYYLLKRLESHLNHFTPYGNQNVVTAIREIKNRVSSWEKPKVYLEHVLMPRLNWFVDLGLITMSEKLEVELTDEGIRLFENLSYWNDINLGFVIDPNEFLKRFSVHLFDNVYYNKEFKNDLTGEQIKSKIDFYLDESFAYFKTLAPNRVTASQAIEFTKYKLYCVDSVKVSYKFVENYLLSTENKMYIYKYQAQYKDGYIQKINYHE